MIAKLKVSDNEYIWFEEAKFGRLKCTNNADKEIAISKEIVENAKDKDWLLNLDFYCSDSIERLKTLAQAKEALKKTVELIASDLSQEVYFSSISSQNIEFVLLKQIVGDINAIFNNKVANAFSSFDTKELYFIIDKLAELFKYFGKKPEDFKDNDARSSEIALYWELKKLVDEKVTDLQRIIRNIKIKKKGHEGDLDTIFS